MYSPNFFVHTLYTHICNIFCHCKDLQDVMLELKDSVANLKKLTSTTCRCNARKENVTVVEVQEKKCLAPPHVIPKEELEESSSENDILDNVSNVCFAII